MRPFCSKIQCDVVFVFLFDLYKYVPIVPNPDRVIFFPSTLCFHLNSLNFFKNRFVVFRCFYTTKLNSENSGVRKLLQWKIVLQFCCMVMPRRENGRAESARQFGVIESRRKHRINGPELFA